jgi:hypothetical protein
MSPLAKLFTTLFRLTRYAMVDLMFFSYASANFDRQKVTTPSCPSLFIRTIGS